MTVWIVMFAFDTFIGVFSSEELAKVCVADLGPGYGGSESFEIYDHVVDNYEEMR